MRLYYFIVFLNILLVIIGIVGNSLVITVVKKTRSMRTTTNFLLVNLAVADIVTLLFNPYLHAAMWPDRTQRSDYICKFFTGNGFVGLPFMVSIFTLVVLAVERYHALVKPMAVGLRLTKDNFHYTVILTWGVSIALNIPIFVDYHFDEARQFCMGVWQLDASKWITRYIALFSSMAIASAFVIGYCYFQILKGLYVTNTICPQNTSENDRQSKKKLTKCLFLVTALFYISQLPFHVFVLFVASVNERKDGHSAVFNVVAFLVFSNSCVNPIVYAFQSANYKSGFKRIFRCQTEISEEDQGPYPLNVPGFVQS